MFFRFLFRFIAVFFLLLFLIRLFNPKVFPALYKALKRVWDFLKYTFKLLVKSSVFTVNLVFTKTLYVIGLDIVFAVVLDVILTVVSTSNYRLWPKIFIGQLFDVYVISFFTFTYLIGLYHYLRKKDHPYPSIFQSFKNFYQKKKKGYYSYDESTNKYTYHE